MWRILRVGGVWSILRGVEICGAEGAHAVHLHYRSCYCSRHIPGWGLSWRGVQRSFGLRCHLAIGLDNIRDIYTTHMYLLIFPVQGTESCLPLISRKPGFFLCLIALSQSVSLLMCGSSWTRISLVLWEKRSNIWEPEFELWECCKLGSESA